MYGNDFYLSFRDDWLQMIGKAYRAGVKIAVGSDLCGYAVEPHVCAREFATLVEAGLSPMDAIKAGTSVGAELLQWDDQIGSLEAGKSADIIAVEINSITQQPLYNPASQLVYTNSGSQVTHSWVAGKPLLENRALCTLNKSELIQSASDWRNKIQPKSMD